MQTIGILGAFNGVGVTHLAINIAKTLQVAKYKVCIVDFSETKSIVSLGEELELINDDAECFEYKGIDFVYKKVTTAQIRREGYDFLIYDFGSKTTDKFFEVDIPILVSSGRIWNLSRGELVNKVDELDEAIGIETLTFVFPFSNKDTMKEIKQFTEGAKTIFTEVDDAFSPSFDLASIGLEKKQTNSLLTSLRGKVDTAQIEKFKKENAHLKNSISSYTNQLEQKDKALEEKENQIKQVEEIHSTEVQKFQEKLATQEENLSELNNQNSELSNKLSEKENILSEKEAELIRREEELKKMEYTATHDVLTKIRNRTGFDKFTSENDLSGKYLVFVDINYLKATNDNLGHDVGNKLICTISDELSKHYDDVFRVGGDEFLVITNDTSRLSEIDDELKSLSNDEIYYEISYGFEEIVSNDVITAKIKADEKMCLNKADKKSKYNPFKEYVDDRLPVSELPFNVYYNDDLKDESNVEESIETIGISRYTDSTTDSTDSTDFVPDESLIQTTDENAKEEVAEKQEVTEEVVEVPKKTTPMLVEGCIPNTVFEENSSDLEKPLSSYWCFEYNIKYERNGMYNERRMYIYPTEVVPAIRTQPVIIAVESVDGYELYSGTQIDLNINGILFKYNSRFTKNGDFIVSVTTEHEQVEMISQPPKKISGEYTPKNFGMVVELSTGKEIEIYPIKVNETGFCDAILKLDDDLDVSKGNECFEGKTYGIVFDTDRFILIGD